MLKKTIDRMLRHRHFWRDVGFDELSELYVSTFFRGLAISLTGLFVPIYLFRLGYSLTIILVTLSSYFTARIFCDLLAAFVVAKIGPKHTMLGGNALQIISMAMFLSVQSIHWPLWLIGGIWGASASFYFIPFHVDFSKVKHAKHGGKEIGYINIMDKIGGGIGPLVGGIIATLFAAKYIFVVAIFMLVLATIALFQTSETVRTKQKLDFSKLPVKKLKKDFLSFAALGVENSFSVALWPLYIAMFVVLSKSVYIKVGVLASVSVITTVYAAHAFGKMIDKNGGRQLLRFNATINGVMHMFRPFVNIFPIAVLVTLINDVITVGYRMPWWKGMYDAADDQPGLRIVYVSSMEIFGVICKATAWWSLVLLSMYLTSNFVVLASGFAIASVASFFIMSERFKALNRN